MQPPERDQADIGLVDETLDASASEHNKDTARQEFKNEADINYMLSRFNVTSPRGTPTYGTWDDSITLQSALDSVREARAGYTTLPDELRKKFPTMEAMLVAVDNGSLVIRTKEEEPKPPQ